MSESTHQPDHDDQDETRVREHRRDLIRRSITIAVWVPAVVTGAWLIAAIAYGRPHSQLLTISAATLLGVAVMVTIWQSIRHGQAELQAAVRAVLPGYERGWSDGQTSGIRTGLDYATRLRKFEDGDGDGEAGGNVYRMPKRRR